MGWFNRLSGCNFLLVQVGESAPFIRQLLEQRSRLPEFAVCAMKFADPVVDFLESDGIGIPHGAAAIGWEAVAVDVDDVDIHSAQGVSLFENAGAFVDQGVDAAIDNFFRRNLALWNAGFGRPFFR